VRLRQEIQALPRAVCIGRHKALPLARGGLMPRGPVRLNQTPVFRDCFWAKATVACGYREPRLAGSPGPTSTFDASGISYSNTDTKVRVRRAVAKVIEAPLIILLLFEPSQGLRIPTRLFSDPASRADLSC
jgi:hypothetical protein